MEEDFSYHWFRNIVRSKHGSRKEREREDQFRGYGCSGTCFSLSGSILKQLSGRNPCSCLFSPGITIQQVSSLHSIVGHEHQAVSISFEGFWWGSLMKVPACHWWEIWYLTAEPPLPRAFVLFKQQTGAIQPSLYANHRGRHFGTSYGRLSPSRLLWPCAGTLSIYCIWKVSFTAIGSRTHNCLFNLSLSVVGGKSSKQRYYTIGH